MLLDTPETYPSCGPLKQAEFHSINFCFWLYMSTADHISGPVMLEQYVAIADYKKQNRNEVNMVAGDIVEVIDKNENGT